MFIQEAENQAQFLPSGINFQLVAVLRPLVFQHQHGNIVKLRRFADKAVDVTANVLHQFRWLRDRFPVQRPEHPLTAEELSCRIGSLRNAVRVNEERVPGVQLELMLPENNSRHYGNRRRMLVYNQFKRSVFPADHRMLMAGVYRPALAGGNFKDPQPYGHKEFFVVSFAKLVIHIPENLRRAVPHLPPVLDQGFGNNHEQGRGNPFTGHVRHHHGQVIFIHQEEVVEVPAHLFRRVHDRKDIELAAVRESRENSGQHIRLDPVGHVQLGADMFLLRGHPGQVVHVIQQVQLHRPGFLIQVADLIPGPDRQVNHVLPGVILVNIGKFICRLAQHLQRLHHRIPHQPDAQRNGENAHDSRENQEEPEKVVTGIHHICHVNIHTHQANRVPRAVCHRVIGGTEPSEIRHGNGGGNMGVGNILAEFPGIFRDHSE